MDPIFFTSAWIFLFIVLIMGVVLSRIWGSSTHFQSDATTGLTGEEKLTLHETFNVLKHDLSANGEKLFILYFEDYPSNKDYFRDFRGKTVEELKGTPKLIAHGTNVICAINGIIMQLNNPSTLVEVVKKSGYGHGKRRISDQSLEELKKSILKLLKENLKSKYNEEVEKVWNKALDVIFSVFQLGVQEYLNENNSS